MTGYWELFSCLASPLLPLLNSIYCVFTMACRNKYHLISDPKNTLPQKICLTWSNDSGGRKKSRFSCLQVETQTNAFCCSQLPVYLEQNCFFSNIIGTQAFPLTSLGSMCILLDFLGLLQNDICFFVNGLGLFNLPFIRLDLCIWNNVLCKDNNSIQGSEKHLAI